ncbi:F-box/LRR-repeat protein 5 [Chionoecetes opilio]|uniref:F-box/LRR-repeat protein 5 n=1 Tax=Chionoecetes opilio TaxID=41210 RepID=A0A8J4XSS2_CHIOP|nr:F-box/LRR-repeat protein 5 [Chionoecetes opilio]
MAPRVPEEIDVFTAPHSRMKELVNIYTRKMRCVDFRDGPEVVSLLKDLDTTLCEFKSHESIENIFIMDQLKNRLKQRQISNAAVCDCHNDNQLSDVGTQRLLCDYKQVVQLVRRGTQVRERSLGERITYGHQLQQAFQDFVNTFLPHMEEEEQVFQPLLVEYFEYDELKVLKEIVLKEHEVVKEQQQQVEKAQDLKEGQPETHSSVKDLRDLDWDLCTLTEALDGLETQKGVSDSGYYPPPLPLPPEQPHLPPDHNNPTQAYPTSTTYHPDLHYPLHPLTSNQTNSGHDQDGYHMHYSDYQTNHYSLPDYQDLQDISFSHQTHHHASPSPSTPALPTEVLVEIFRYLAVPDLCRCAQVSSSWNNAVFSPTLWTALYPVQWARGIWERRDVGLCDMLEAEAHHHQQQQGGGGKKWDEDADVDESEEGKEGSMSHKVTTPSVPPAWCGGCCRGSGRASVPWWWTRARASPPASSTKPSSSAPTSPPSPLHTPPSTPTPSKGMKATVAGAVVVTWLSPCRLWLQEGLHRLRRVDLQGCQLIDDVALHYLALCVGQGSRQSPLSLPAPPCLQEWVYEGGCSRCGYSGPTWPNMPCQGRNRRNRSSQGPLRVHLNSPDADIEEIYCPPRGLEGWEVMMRDTCRSGNQTSSRRPSLVSLNLSGCWRIRDKGLLAFGASGGLLGLTFLDVSGCYQLTDKDWRPWRGFVRPSPPPSCGTVTTSWTAPTPPWPTGAPTWPTRTEAVSHFLKEWPADIANLKFAPAANVDVERSFSIYKNSPSQSPSQSPWPHYGVHEMARKDPRPTVFTAIPTMRLRVHVNEVKM